VGWSAQPDAGRGHALCLPIPESACRCRPDSHELRSGDRSNTAWPGRRPGSLRDIDDPEKTILLVEVDDAGIPWMEPRDIAIDEVLAGADGLGKAITSCHTMETYFYYWARQGPGGCVLTADTAVHYLAGHPSREDLAMLLNIDGPSLWGRAMWTFNLAR